MSQDAREKEKSTILLALGNDILGDDAVGLVAAEELGKGLSDDVELVAHPGGGLALLDLLAGYEKALILDCVMTGQNPPGTVLEFSGDHFMGVLGTSPHYAGLPEVLQLAAHLHIPFPKDIRIVAIEVADPFVLREGLSDEMERALPAFVAKARETLAQLAANGG